MATVFLDSANGGDVSTRWNVGTPNATPGAASPSGRGSYLLGANNAEILEYAFATPPSQSSIGFYSRMTSYTSNDNNSSARMLQHVGPTGTVHLSQTLGLAGEIILRLGSPTGTLLASSANGVFSLDTWHHMEVACQIADSGGRYIVWVDGLEVINFTGDTRNGGADTTVGFIRLGRVAIGEHNVSDIRVGTGLTQVGVSTVWMSLPDGAGNTTGLNQEPATGSNFQKVDENPPNGDTDYVYSDTQGVFDLYTMSNMPASPTGSWDVVAVQTTFNCRASDGGSKFIRPVIRSGGSNATGASQVLPAGYISRMEVFENNPVTAAPWTEAEVNALEVGPEVRDS